MGGGSKTNVTNTGLGDEQFKTLTGNQDNIASSIDKGRVDATKRINKVDTSLSNVRKDISGVGTNLTSGFTNLRDLVGKGMKANQQGFTGVTNNINKATGKIQTGMTTGFDDVNQNLDTGFGTMDKRFNRVDTAQQTAQTALDTGFQDTTNNFSDLNTRLTDDFTAAQGTLDTGFADVGQGLSDLDSNTQNRLDTVQGNVLTGQSILDQGITGVSNAQDIYYGDLSERQTEIQQGQDGFQSTFDDYVQRYSDDTTLANQTRADIQTGLVNSTDRIRTDMGNFAQAAATGNATLSGQLSDTERASRDALGNLNTAVQGGFTGQAMSAQQAQQNLVTRLGNLGSMVDTVGSTLDTNTRQQYSSMMSSFDDNGNLIRNSIDAQGNTIQRSMDDQGNLVLGRFDQAGNQIDQVGMNVNDMLTNAERYQQSLTGQIGQGFNSTAGTLDAASRNLVSIASQQGSLDDAMRSQFNQLSSSFDQNGNLIRSSIDEQGNTLRRGIDAQGNLIVTRFDQAGNQIDQVDLGVNDMLSRAEQYQQSLTGQIGDFQSTTDQGFTQVRNEIGTNFDLGQQQAASLFDAQQGAISRQGLDIINTVGSQLGNLDQASQQQYQSLSQAFDQNGNLVTQSVDELGNSISRQVDETGNLTIRRLDQTGRMIDQSSLNVTGLLSDLGTSTGTLQNTQTSLADRVNQGFSSLDQGLMSTQQAGMDQFQQLQGSIGTGFNATSGTLDVASRNLASLASQQDNLDQGMRSQFTQLASSFDENGNLISSSIDEQGNTIGRSIDAQGNLVISRFDQAGNQIDQVGLGVNDVLSQAQQNQQNLQNQIGSFESTADQGFGQLQQSLGTGFSTSQQQAASLFDSQRSAISSQGLEILNTVGSQLGNLDQATQQQYQSLSQAFDSNGNLVAQSVDDLGNSISRQMDENGNLTIRRLDETGRQIDQSNINVTSLLGDLGNRTGTLQNTQTSLAGRLEQGFAAVSEVQAQGIDQVRRDIGTGFDVTNGRINEQGLSILSSVGGQLENLDAATRQQFDEVSSSFDQQGDLIQTSSDAQGNRIERQLDQTGNLITQRFDATGQLIDQNNYDVTGILRDLGTRTGTLQQSLTGRLDQGFASMSDSQTQGFNQLGQGQTQIQQQGQQGFSELNQGLMSSQRNSMTELQRMSTDIMSGFDSANGVMDTQTRDIAKVAAQQGNLNDSMRLQFSEIGDAFDDNGRLIQNSILNNGNIISRNIDDNGNLLLRAFDTTGNTIGNQVVNINRALTDLSQLDFYAGANVSMGNLSPAMRGAVPTSGFASPFTTTR